MKILGIVAEYNPFHLGHLYHMEEAKRLTGATHTVIVMSGNFVQRGEPAIVDKWTRAAMAVDNGADLVLELPTVFASSSAEYFGQGGISLLDSLKVVDCVAYGSETGSHETLREAAEILVGESPVFKEVLQDGLERGLSFPSAREIAMNRVRPGLKGLLGHSNNILAVEYLKAAKRLGSAMEFKAVLRRGADFNETGLKSGSFSSATALRGELVENGSAGLESHLPKAAFMRLKETEKKQKGRFLGNEDYFSLIQYRLLVSEDDELRAVAGMREGLEYRLKKAARHAATYESFVETVQTKRYPRSAIQRLLIHLLLNLKKTDLEDFKNCGRSYGRVLGFNEKGREILKIAKKCSKTALLTNINRQMPMDPVLARMLGFDVKATDLYMLMSAKYGDPWAGNQDMLRRPYSI